jgi:transcriptional regulator of arginine metabolism
MSSQLRKPPFCATIEESRGDDMRYSRQNKILELIESQVVDTQERLLELLREAGYNVTQATISRDIKDLQLVKTMTYEGGHKYTVAGKLDHQVTDRFAKIFKETILSVASSGNVIVIKTLSGCANAAGETIDAMGLPHILGSIAGDNTIFIIVNDPQNVGELTERFNEILS